MKKFDCASRSPLAHRDLHRRRREPAGARATRGGPASARGRGLSVRTVPAPTMIASPRRAPRRPARSPPRWTARAAAADRPGSRRATRCSSARCTGAQAWPAGGGGTTGTGGGGGTSAAACADPLQPAGSQKSRPHGHDCGQHAGRDHRANIHDEHRVGSHAHGDAGTGGPDDAQRWGHRDGHIVGRVRAFAHVHDQLPLRRSAPQVRRATTSRPFTDRAGRASRRRPTPAR